MFGAVALWKELDSGDCSAPPASSTVTTLFTPHKQAGRTPRLEAAPCHCHRWEADTNSHVQNDTVSQLEQRAKGEISAVRSCRQIAVLSGFNAGLCQTPAGS